MNNSDLADEEAGKAVECIFSEEGYYVVILDSRNKKRHEQ